MEKIKEILLIVPIFFLVYSFWYILYCVSSFLFYSVFLDSYLEKNPFIRHSRQFF